MKKCFYHFITLLILLPIKSHAKIASDEFIYNPPVLHISTKEEFADYRFYYTLNPLCSHCWRHTITPNMIIQDNFSGTFLIQPCKLLENKKTYIKYKCTNLYNPKETDIFEFAIKRWDPIFKAYVVEQNAYSTKGDFEEGYSYTIDIPKQEKD